MTLDVVVNPRHDAATAWLSSNVLSVHKLFIKLHVVPKESPLRKYHPHGLHVHLPMAPDKSIPELYVFTDAHWDQAHVGQTMNDIREAIRGLGGLIEDFDIQGTEGSSREEE